MKRSDFPIPNPCGADWSAMTPETARARLCGECSTTVHDLSAMHPDEASALLASGPVCVRYLYDAHGKIIFGLPRDAQVVPASALLSRAGQRRWAAMAAVAASAIVFEACGGAGPEDYRNVDADGGRVPASPGIGDDDDAGPRDAASDADAD